MRRVFRAVSIVVVALWALPAVAQTATGAKVPAGPIVNSWYLGANTGAAAVQKFGSVAGAEGGIRAWKHLDLVGEIVWAQDAVSRRQLDKVDVLARSLAATQNGAATGTMKVPTLYSGLGGRWVIETEGKFRPYFLLTIGGARTTLTPVLKLNGADVTSTASQYGVTLGQDVIGRYNSVATDAGAGLLMGFGTFYLDLGARVISVSEKDERVNIGRLVLGGGYRF